MSYINTTNQGAPYPNVNEPINNVNDWIKALAEFQEVRGVQRFTDATDLATKRPTPTAGEFAYNIADKTLSVYDGTGWKRVYPPSPMVYTGTTTPSSSLGQTGDLYVKTT